MEASQLATLEALKALAAAKPDAEVAIVSRLKEDDPPPPERRVLNLGTDAKAFFREAIQKSVVKQIPRWNLRALDILYKPEEHEVEYSSLDDAPAVRQDVDTFVNLAGLEALSPSEEEFIRNLRYSVVALTAGDERAYFFRVFTASNELRRKPGAALVYRAGMYSKVEEQIFLFTEQVDCIVFRDTVFILNKRNYREIFQLLAQVRGQAEAAADALQAVVPIENFEEFKAACASQTAMSDKLIEVSKRDYFDTLSIQSLEPIIEEFSLNVSIGSNGASLVFDPRPAGRWHILRLLDDDYLRSSLTEHRYEVNSKTAR